MLDGLGRQAEARAEAQEALRLAPNDPNARLAAALVLFKDDLRRQRHELLVSAYLAPGGDPMMLLAYTYLRPSDFSPALPIASEVSPLPSGLRRSLQASLPRGVTSLEAAAQQYRIGIRTYRSDFLRQPPAIILIPGDWTALSSPRTQLILAALAAP
jgi:hypothetical protein